MTKTTAPSTQEEKTADIVRRLLGPLEIRQLEVIAYHHWYACSNDTYDGYHRPLIEKLVDDALGSKEKGEALKCTLCFETPEKLKKFTGLTSEDSFQRAVLEIAPIWKRARVANIRYNKTIHTLYFKLLPPKVPLSIRSVLAWLFG